MLFNSRQKLLEDAELSDSGLEDEDKKGSGKRQAAPSWSSGCKSPAKDSKAVEDQRI